jgi:outer membrane protein assembly factor BamB
MVGGVGVARSCYPWMGRWVTGLVAWAVGLIGLSTNALASGLPPATLSFHSQPALHPPQVAVTSNPDSGSGDIFLTPSHSYQGGPMILGPQGHLIWFQPIFAWTANLELQHYHGRPVLTWWQGRSPTSGREDVIMDSSYRIVAVLYGANGYPPDLHEFQITPQNTALINGLRAITGDLTNYGGPAKGSVDDNVIQELNIQTGKAIWQWHALGHVPLTDSYQEMPSSGPYDYFHLNSIQQLPDGNLLVSARNTSAVYLINKQTGMIIWTLGGKHSSFKMGPGTTFRWQHDAHLVGQTVTLFNDGWGGAGYPQSSPSEGITLHLSTKTMTATLVHRYTHSPSVTAGTQGSMETLPNGNVFVGWGSDPDFSEYSPSGSQLFNGNFALGVKTYRAYRFPWSGQPLSPPALAATASSTGGTTLYASWNGATQVRTWRVLGGSSPKTLHGMGRARKHGFETRINLASSLPYFAVQALDSKSAVLGTSVTRTVHH